MLNKRFPHLKDFTACPLLPLILIPFTQNSNIRMKQTQNILSQLYFCAAIGVFFLWFCLGFKSRLSIKLSQISDNLIYFPGKLHNEKFAWKIACQACKMGTNCITDWEEDQVLITPLNFIWLYIAPPNRNVTWNMEGYPVIRAQSSHSTISCCSSNGPWRSEECWVTKRSREEKGKKWGNPEARNVFLMQMKCHCNT